MRCYHGIESQNGYGECPKCWDKDKSICPGCHKEITNKAYFSGAHVKGKCHRPKSPEILPKPTVLIHPSKAMLAAKVPDSETGRHAYKDWEHHPNGAIRFPETYPELYQWWKLPVMGE